MDASVQLGERLGIWAVAPFALMLLAVAVLPLAAGRWFDHNRNKAITAAVLGVPTVIYLVARYGHPALVSSGHTGKDYISFMVLLFALFTISGGIHLSGDIRATPWINLLILGGGAILANVIGTMGAAMLLIHPLLRINTERTRVKHTVVFFIFLVGNIGGLLTPVGPPLYLGYLRGVAFTWTLRLWPQWLLSVGLTLLVYLALEIYNYRKEPESALLADFENYVPIRLTGRVNIPLLLLVVVAVFFSDPLDRAGESFHFPFLRDLILLVIAGLSLVLTRRGSHGPREANGFRWSPLVEVAILFAGIFATMVPALALLQAKGASAGLTHPWQFYWSAGGLSAFLDNAPTYLAFATLGQGMVHATSLAGLTSTTMVAGLGFAPARLLAAVSCGAVMMGSLSYLGNAPNFAVKAIAEHSGRKMPSFFGYMGYSMVVLVPVFLITTVVFFR
jgi:Na+/H+ antiporter NhaD/arsenite permease-like protein